MSDAPLSLLPVDATDPYIGLKPYTEAERDRFFGRERDAQLLINKLFSHPLTLLYAPSGVGKTSLLRALVMPELRGEEAQVVYFDKWNSLDPCDAVAQVIAGGDVPAGQGQLVDAAKLRLTRDSTTLVLVLDQFEEYLQRYAGDLGMLPAALGALLRAGLDVRVVLSFREEFLASVDACLRAHVLALFASTYHLEHLDRERAREAIMAPALKFGGRCDEVLVDQLVDDLAPSDAERGVARLFRGGIELPFLQLICRCLWEHARQAGAAGLRMADYRKLGGRRGIIAGYLREVTHNFGPLQSLDAAKVLKALAPRSGVKIAYPIDALAAQAQLSEARARHVLDILQQHRIVRTRDAGGSVSYELQHDAFIEIVRPWAEQRFRCRNRLIGGLAGLLLLAGIGLNALLWQNERQEREDRRVAAELTDRIDVDARKALEEALALAQVSRDHNVSNALRLAISNFLQNPALAPHKGAANVAAYSADGRWILTAGEDGEARLVDSQTLQVRARVKHAAAVVAVAASADGQRLVSAGRDGVLRVWDAAGHELTVCGRAGGSPWVDADISKDGRRVAGIRESEDGTAPDLLVTAVGGVCALTRLSGHFGNVGSAVLDDAGERVLSFGNNDNTARVWNAVSGVLLATLTHPDEVLSASFSADGQQVVVAVADGSIYRWTTSGHVIGRPLEIPVDPVEAEQRPVLATSARLSPDGRRLVAASSDGHIYLWTLGEGEQAAGPAQILQGVHPGGALSVQFSQDGKRILSFGVDDTLRVWDTPFSFLARELRGHTQGVRSATFSPDGREVLSAGADGAVKLWRLQAPDLLPPTGNGLILGGNGQYSFRLSTGQLFASSAPGAPRDLLQKGESVRSATFSRDGALLAVGMASGRLRVVESAGGTTRFETDDLESPLFALAFDGEGRRLASGGADGRLRLYELASPRADRSGIDAHAGPVFSLDVSPDGSRLVSTGADGAARVWAWGAGHAPLSTLEGEADRVRDARFSDDGRRILKRNGDRISTFDGNAWARSDAELPAYARSLLGFSAK